MASREMVVLLQCITRNHYLDPMRPTLDHRVGVCSRRNRGISHVLGLPRTAEVKIPAAWKMVQRIRMEYFPDLFETMSGGYRKSMVFIRLNNEPGSDQVDVQI